MANDPPHVSLRFANTARGRDDDPIATPAALDAWLEATLPLGHAAESPSHDADRRLPSPGGPSRTSLPEARRLFDEAIRLRTAFAEALEAVRGRRSVPAPSLAVIERSLSAGRWRRSVATSGPALALESEPVPSSDPLARLSPLAADLIELLSGADPDRLRTCADEACGRWFLDTSRGGRRRWCSMSTCGNRAKAERWRARHRDG